jgi:hypothetical protein
MSIRMKITSAVLALWSASLSFAQPPLVISENNFTIDIGNLSEELREVLERNNPSTLQIFATKVDGEKIKITLSNPRVLESDVLQAGISNFSNLPFGNFQLSGLSFVAPNFAVPLSYSGTKKYINYEEGQVIIFLDSHKSPYIMGADGEQIDKFIEDSGAEIISLSQNDGNHRIAWCEGALLVVDYKSYIGLQRPSALESSKLTNVTFGALPNPRTRLIEAEINNNVANQEYISAFGKDFRQGSMSNKSVTIAVLDSGVSAEVLGESSIEEFIFVGPHGEPGDIYARTDSKNNLYKYHGTVVAQLARQVAPEAKILSIRVCDAVGICYIPSIIQGICRAIEEVGNDAVVLNMSFGTNEVGVYSPLLNRIIKDALALDNVFVTVAAGNKGEGEDYSCDKDYSGNDSKPFYPASLEYVYEDQDKIDGIIAVGATQFSRGGEWQPANFSVNESYIDVFAPGTCLSVKDIEHSRSGTSFSTGLISGVIVHMIEKAKQIETSMQKEFTLKPSAVEDCLKRHSATTGMPNVTAILDDMGNFNLDGPVCDGN